VDSANERQKRVLFTKLSSAMGGDVSGRRVAVWGLSFKPQTDDVRESPALRLIDDLIDAGARVVAHDPVAIPAARQHFNGHVESGQVAFAASSYAAAEGADALVIATDWNEYRNPNFKRMRDALATPLVVDGRNLYDPRQMATLGFDYHSLGRPSVPTHEAHQ